MSLPTGLYYISNASDSQAYLDKLVNLTVVTLPENPNTAVWEVVNYDNGLYTIADPDTGLVLDMVRPTGAVLLYESHGGDNQLWSMQRAGPRSFVIRTADAQQNGCLATAIPPVGGTGVVTVRPSTGQASERWLFQPAN